MREVTLPVTDLADIEAQVACFREHSAVILPDLLSPDEVGARIEEYRALGISHFLLWFMDFPRLEGIRLFAETVLPRFAAASNRDNTASN